MTGAAPGQPDRKPGPLREIGAFLDRAAQEPEVSRVRARIVDEPGRLLTLRIRRPEGSPTPWKDRNVDFLRDQGLRPLLEAGLLHHVRDGAEVTHRQTVQGLRNGWTTFTTCARRADGTSRRDLAIDRISAADLVAFADFLKLSRIGNAERRNRAGAFRTVMEAAALSGKLGPAQAAALDALRGLPIWRDLLKRSQSPSGSVRSEAEEAGKFLSDARMQAILAAATTDIREITEAWDTARAGIARGRERLDPDHPPGLDALQADRDLALA